MTGSSADDVGLSRPGLVVHRTRSCAAESDFPQPCDGARLDAARETVDVHGSGALAGVHESSVGDGCTSGACGGDETDA